MITVDGVPSCVHCGSLSRVAHNEGCPTLLKTQNREVVICPRCAKAKSGIHTCSPSDLVLGLEQEIERLRNALQSIAGNTCCETCREAALVAASALRGEGE